MSTITNVIKENKVIKTLREAFSGFILMLSDNGESDLSLDAIMNTINENGNNTESKEKLLNDLINSVNRVDEWAKEINDNANFGDVLPNNRSFVDGLKTDARPEGNNNSLKQEEIKGEERIK